MLWGEIQRRRYEGDAKDWEVESEATTAIFRIERRGVRVDMDLFQRKRETVGDEIDASLNRLLELGAPYSRVDVASTTQLRSFIVEGLGLPVLGLTKTKKAKIDAGALQEYSELPHVLADEKLSSFFHNVKQYKNRSQFMSLYLNGWGEHISDSDMLHPNYNQYVATGRMSSKHPNVQQLNTEAKRLIIPKNSGLSFARRDFSQVEYRVISFLADDKQVIEAYQKDPTTDFHTYVAKMCGIDRKPAKSVNFGIAFGMGESGLIKQLKRHFPAATAVAQAETLLRRYDNKFPNIRKISKEAKKLAKDSGWIRTLYGARRALKYMPYGEGDDQTRKAFNSAVQGTAAGFIKEAMVKMELKRHEMENPMPQEVEMEISVHDEILFEGPHELMQGANFDAFVAEGMCKPSVEFSVPLLVSGGQSNKSWAEAE
jgi:DNA polymerase-1